MSPSVHDRVDRDERVTASLSQGPNGEAPASEAHLPASDLLVHGLAGRGSSPLPLRSPGMHLGHDLLHALTFAVVLLATLVLNAIHHC